MASSMDECVLDFDIELLHNSSKYELEKALHTIRVLKTKITRTSDVLKKYYAKVAECKQLEDLALATKEDYQHACMENLTFREQTAGLEEEIKKANEGTKLLEEKYNNVLNQYEGIQSHSRQLELLVKENESKIEALKGENELEKLTVKESEKKCAVLEKELDYMKQNICRVKHVVLGKKKVTKEIKLFLNKYGSSDGNDNDGEISSDEDTFEDCLSPLATEIDGDLGSLAGKKVETVLKNQSNKFKEENTNIEDDSESSTGVVSSDTGRGSSLACSLAGSILSPEYFINHSPSSGEIVASKNKMVISIATSPILTREVSSIATSPIIFKDMLSKEIETEHSELSNKESLHSKIQSNSSPPVLIDRVVSPIFVAEKVDTLASGEKNTNCVSGISPLRRSRRITDRNSTSDPNTREKENSITNNINDFDDESSDGEIQMIFHKMRFNQNLITPLPTTPAKSRAEAAANIATQTLATHAAGACPDAVRLQQDNAALKDTVDKLAQQVTTMNDTFMKCFLSILNANTANTEAQKMLREKCSLEENGTSIFQNLEPKAPLVGDKDESVDKSDVIKTKTGFKERISKMKELFDDSSPPSPNTSFEHLVAPAATVVSRAPSPARSLRSPPSSPRRHSASPPRCLSLSPTPADDNDTSNISNQQNISFRSKENLQFEDPLSNEGSISGETPSDREMYEHEIVVELAPDSNESDRTSLHAILMEQQLAAPEERPVDSGEKSVTKTPKKKLTKLEKLRKNMAPRRKIAKERSPERRTRQKLRIQPKRLTANRQRILGDSVSPESNKAAYEKACKVMAELKSKEKVLTKKPSSGSAPIMNALKSIRNETSSPVIETGVYNQKHTQSTGHDSILVVEKLSPVSPNKLPEKDRPVQTRTNLDYTKQRNENRHSSITPSKPIETSKCVAAEKNTSVPRLLTRNQSKSESEQVCVLEPTQFDTNHLKSPALKRYNRNVVLNKSETNNNTQMQSFVQQDNLIISEDKNVNTEAITPDSRKRLKRPAGDKPDIIPKRILRSSSIQYENEKEAMHPESLPDQDIQTKIQREVSKEIISYDDLDLFNNSDVDKPDKPMPNASEVDKPAKPDKPMPNASEVDKPAKPDKPMPNASGASAKQSNNKKPGILCTFIDKYGRRNMKHAPKIPDNVVSAICAQLEDSIAHIQKLPPQDTKPAMDQLVKELKTKPSDHVIFALINFLKEPARKIESYNKINVPPAPPMTKVEQILIYVVAQLKLNWTNLNVVESILSYIEYTLFLLNRTPDFDVIETLSHFYAVLCRYNKDRNRLRLFIIDAMYCLQYKAVPLIKQCIDVWMHILPLAHLGLAKNPLVQCLVYLLHFYKCDDKFNRVQEIRNILHRKYSYEVSEWNEPGILEMIRTCILELRDISGEKKMIRMSLVIIAKRNGAQWCQKHIIKNMLLPIIEQATVPDRIKQFCIALLGPLLKPFPMEMKVNCEIVMNQLFDILDRNPSPQMEEAVFTSLIFMSRHNVRRVVRALLCWSPERISPEFEELLRNFVRERPVKSWKQLVSKIFIHN
ncbi:uncharacterized protein LOC125227274 isoform X2 [Leguminivora glycinivorella]|uniref:uncharacterized protein LOC125227274 isoform X2 n=1 Tax=Leguminivora glycinivorella TaxID=1035111 RepID=UPI00200CBBB7|nr:uncharacterized protein LOC125227274 isoform X2 [Leguminivora glycinivorella]